jgi:hypothetical protein
LDEADDDVEDDRRENHIRVNRIFERVANRGRADEDRDERTGKLPAEDRPPRPTAGRRESVRAVRLAAATDR